MRILIIEDDKWFAESVASFVLEHDIKIANDAEMAMDLIDKWQPELLILDIMLGAKNGLTLLHELQSYLDTRQIPIIILSVDGKRLDLDDLRCYGVKQIIDKSEMTPKLICSTINTVV